MIKPNMDEIKALIGNDINNQEDLIEAAVNLHNSGIELVVISCGSQGSFIACDTGIYQAIVPKIDAVNTVGCGDSMIAGFAVGLSQGIEIEETIRLASAFSVANAMREETGFIIYSDMENLLPQIKINKIK